MYDKERDRERVLERSEDTSWLKPRLSILSFILYIIIPLINFTVCFYLALDHSASLSIAQNPWLVLEGHQRHTRGGCKDSSSGSGVKEHRIGSVGINNIHSLETEKKGSSVYPLKLETSIIYQDIDCEENEEKPPPSPFSTTTRERASCVSNQAQHTPLLHTIENKVLDRARHERMYYP